MTEHDALSGQPGPVDNGLRAAAYVPLTDVDPQTGRYLLTALGRARIAAYLLPDAGAAGGAVAQSRLFVAAEERTDARTIVQAAVRALRNADRQDGTDPGDRQVGTDSGAPGAAPDPLAGMDTDEAFRALIADWHVDTHDAIRAAERDLRREDAEWRARLGRPPANEPVWLDDDHYVPPPPPPLPRLARPTVVALTVLVISILVLALGGQIGLPGRLSLVLGIAGLLAAAGIFFTRLRERRRDDEDDDGAAI